MSERWEGNSSPEDHRSTAGGRAWNFSWHQWCYPDDWCETCRRDKWGDPWEMISEVQRLYDFYRTTPMSECSQGDLLGEIARVLAVNSDE